MKVLVVSSVPWDRNNNFGKTFCDIFEGMDDLEFLNIYCNSGQPNNDVKATYYQIPITDIIKNLLCPKHKVGKYIENVSQVTVLNEREQKILDGAKAYRLRVFLWARRFIWWIGRWRTPELDHTIREFDADLLFLPIFKESYMNAVQQYVMKICNKKVVAYYGDDNYTLRFVSMNPFFWLDRLTQRRMVKKTIDACEYMYVVSDIEKEECERDFKKQCFICTKGADFSGIPLLKEKYQECKRLVYTGNLGNHRWEELVQIGYALDKINQNHKLYIYSGTPLTNTMRKQFQKTQSIEFMGKVPVEDIPLIQSEADILVHVESFRLKERFAVHQSFSTKLVDHFARARCTFAVGAPDVASIDYLLKYDAAVVASKRDKIEEKLRMIVNNDDILNEYALKAYKCGQQMHDLKHIQKQLRKHFQEILGVNCEDTNC